MRQDLTPEVVAADYRKTQSMQKTADNLGASLGTIFKRIRSYNAAHENDPVPIGHAPVVPRGLSAVSMEILNAFRHHMTISDLSRQFNTSRPRIRYHLARAARLLWSTRHTFPPPLEPPIEMHETRLFRVYNLLHDKPSLYDSPEVISEVTNVPLDAVNNYLQRMFEWQSRRNAVIEARVAQQSAQKAAAERTRAEVIKAAEKRKKTRDQHNLPYPSGYKRYPPRGRYKKIPCQCLETCPRPCDGKLCNCKACAQRHQDETTVPVIPGVVINTDVPLTTAAELNEALNHLGFTPPIEGEVPKKEHDHDVTNPIETIRGMD